MWIRDKLLEHTNYINADKIDNNNLIDVSISQFDKKKILILKKIIISKKASIKDNKWLLENVVVNTDNNPQKFDYLEFYSNFNLEKILSIFENFSSLNIFKWKI